MHVHNEYSFINISMNTHMRIRMHEYIHSCMYICFHCYALYYLLFYCMYFPLYGINLMNELTSFYPYFEYNLFLVFSLFRTFPIFGTLTLLCALIYYETLYIALAIAFGLFHFILPFRFYIFYFTFSIFHL